MKAVIQRVTNSCVKVDGETISSIERGLLVLIGIFQEDEIDDLNYIANKILSIKIFEDEDGKRWSRNVIQKQYDILCVSQFTLCHKLNGNNLDFHHAMNPVESEKFYESLLEKLRKQYQPEKIKSGKFGALMQVELCNDGPVTITLKTPPKKLDSSNRESVKIDTTEIKK